MNDIDKARLRLFCILFAVVVAAHVVALYYFHTRAKSADREKEEAKPAAAAAAKPAEAGKPAAEEPPQHPLYRFRMRSANANFGKPLDYRAAIPLPAALHALDESKSGILVDLDTHAVLWAKRPDDPVPVASMVKMMTLLLTFEALERDPRISLDSKVEVTRTVLKVPRTGIVWLDPRETFPLSELLKAVAIKSANDAAIQVAEFIGGNVDSFTDEMNRRAGEIHMARTKFANPCGLPDKKRGNSYSTPADLVMLAERLLEYPQLLQWSHTSTDWIRDRRTVLNNTNGLIRRNVPGVDGLKTGFINASGFCLTFTAIRDNHRLVGVVTGFPTARRRDNFCIKLLDWGYAREGVHPAPLPATAKRK